MTDGAADREPLDVSVVRPIGAGRESPISLHRAASAPVSDRGRSWERRLSVAVRVLADVTVPRLVAATSLELAAGASLFAVGVVLTGQWSGLYRERFTQSVLDELPRLVLMVASGGALAALGVRLVGRNRTPDLAQLGLLTFVTLLISRLVIYHLDGRARRRNRRILGRVLVVGGGAMANELMRRITEHPELGLRAAGILDAARLKPIGWPVLGTIHDLPSMLRMNHIDVVLIAFPEVPEGEIFEVIRSCEFGDAELYTVSAWFSLRGGHGSTADRVWGIPVTRVTPARRRGIAWRGKRVIDVVVSGVCLLFLSPLLAALALAVRCEGGRGVIFRQARVGLDGKLITIMKFRTMRPAAVEESDTTWSIVGDAWIGPVGRFLRTSSLDELPQLVNVLRGEMSLVGPRPERPHFVRRYEPQFPDYRYRHRMPVGMTGYAAVNGLRGDTSIEERAYFDNLYIESWSLGLDAMILCRTVLAVFRRHGG